MAGVRFPRAVLTLLNAKQTTMTVSEFIAINKTGKKPQFRDLIGLKKSNHTAKLIDFVTRLHPNTSKVAQDGVCTVYLSSGKQYIYTAYNGCIVRTCKDSKERKMYTLKS